jgi:hypothetical protein
MNRRQGGIVDNERMGSHPKCFSSDSVFRVDPACRAQRGESMDEKWVKPTAEALAVNGECTAYSGVDAAQMTAGEMPLAVGSSLGFSSSPAEAE